MIIQEWVSQDVTVDFRTGNPSIIYSSLGDWLRRTRVEGSTYSYGRSVLNEKQEKSASGREKSPQIGQSSE
jgi:hypothetical protein